MKLRVFNFIFFLVAATSFAQPLKVDTSNDTVIATIPNEVAIMVDTSSTPYFTQNIVHTNSNNAFNVLEYESIHINNNYKYN